MTERNIQLQTEREAAKNSSNKTKFKDIHNGITEVQNQLAASTLALARLLKTHPSVAQNLLKIQQERSSLHSLLQKSIKELRELKCETLVSTVEEEYKKRNILQNTINRERDQQELFKDLQLELGVEKKLITDEINDRNQVIQQLKDTIQEINALTSSEQKYIKKEVKSHEASVKNSCAYKESQLVQKRAKIAAEINQEHRVHTSIMKFLADERAVLEFEIQEWMTKYEEDTECKTLELEQLKLKRTADLDKFEELVGAYEVLEKTVDDDKSVRALEQEEMRMVQRREVACVHIQKWYRKWKQVRMQLVIYNLYRQLQKHRLRRARKPPRLRRERSNKRFSKSVSPFLFSE